MFSGWGAVLAVILAYMLAFTTVKGDGVIELIAVFLIGSWLVNL